MDKRFEVPLQRPGGAPFTFALSGVEHMRTYRQHRLHQGDPEALRKTVEKLFLDGIDGRFRINFTPLDLYVTRSLLEQGAFGDSPGLIAAATQALSTATARAHAMTSEPGMAVHVKGIAAFRTSVPMMFFSKNRTTFDVGMMRLVRGGGLEGLCTMHQYLRRLTTLTTADEARILQDGSDYVLASLLEMVRDVRSARSGGEQTVNRRMRLMLRRLTDGLIERFARK